MNLDLRIPMGLMFTLVGLILSVFGLMTMGDPDVPEVRRAERQSGLGSGAALLRRYNVSSGPRRAEEGDERAAQQG